MTRRIPFVLTLFAGITAVAASQTPTDPLNPRGDRGVNLANQSLPDLDKPIPGTLKHPHTYDITPDSGPWAICVMSYAGPLAGSLAFDLVSELRKEYKLPGYLYNRSEEARKQEKERVEALRRQRHDFYRQQGLPESQWPETAHLWRQMRIEAQYGVLIADPKFKTIDDARHALDQIRKLPPPPEKLMDRAAVAGEGMVRGGYINPFTTAFVVPNPTVPIKKAPPPAEPFANLRRLNSAEEYSLFKCPGAWTLVVKSYQGASVIVSKDSEKSLMDRFGLGNDKQGDLLQASALAAHKLAEVLRDKQLNFESYVLHTRNYSIVTVGSFDSEKDPRMQQMMAQLSRLHFDLESLSPPTPYKVPK